MHRLGRFLAHIANLGQGRNSAARCECDNTTAKLFHLLRGYEAATVVTASKLETQKRGVGLPFWNTDAAWWWNCQALSPHQPHLLVLCQQCLYSPEEEKRRGSDPRDAKQLAAGLAAPRWSREGGALELHLLHRETTSHGRRGQGREILLTSKCHLDSEEGSAAIYFPTRKTSSGFVNLCETFTRCERFFYGQFGVWRPRPHIQVEELHGSSIAFRCRADFTSQKMFK